MTLMTVDQFVTKDDAEYIELDVPAWGEVRLKSLTGTARDSYYREQFKEKNGEDEFQVEDSSARLLALSLCDEKGKLWFSNSNKGVEVLRQKSARCLQIAFDAAMKLNGLSEEEIEDAKKDSAPTVKDATGSD